MSGDEREPDGLDRMGVTEAQVRAAQRGDVLAANDLLDALMPHVLAVCRQVAPDEAADAAQEALLAVFLHLPALRDPRALPGWVTTIARREAVRLAARRRPEPRAELADRAAPGEPQTEVDVRHVLTRLPAHQRQVLALKVFGGLDDLAIARRLSLAAGTVRSRLSRARSAFRREWTR